MTSPAASERVDLLVVGAGIVGLGHAVQALARGARVAVVERDERAVGASIRNFGHCCITAQTGEALGYALAARSQWLRLAKEAGFWVRDAGTVVVARADDEYAVLEDLHRERGDDVVLLDARQVRRRAPLADDTIVGGAWLPLDLRVDPREACRAIADWLAKQGVRFHWSTSVLGIDGDTVRTNRGVLQAGKVVVAVGHDVDRLYPDIAEAHGLRRCSLHMLQLSGPVGTDIAPAVFTGWSMLHYDGFAVSPALERVRKRLGNINPDAAAAGLNLMVTQRPDGDLVVGDTHDYARTVDPFRAEQRDDLLLDETRRLLGLTAVHVRQRWLGVYASAPAPFLTAAPTADLRIVSVTSGIGMTTGFGLAEQVVNDLLG